jgi:hypothetical protein
MESLSGGIESVRDKTLRRAMQAGSRDARLLRLRFVAVEHQHAVPALADCEY